MPTQTFVLMSEVHQLCRERKKKAEWAISELVNPPLNGHVMSLALEPYVIILDHFLSFPLLIMDVVQLPGVNTLMHCSPSKSYAPNVISML